MGTELVMSSIYCKYLKHHKIKLANHASLFCSHGDTGHLMKYIDPLLELDKNGFSCLRTRQGEEFTFEMSFQIRIFGLGAFCSKLEIPSSPHY